MAEWLIGFYIFKKISGLVFFCEGVFSSVIEMYDPDPKYNKEENRGLCAMCTS